MLFLSNKRFVEIIPLTLSVCGAMAGLVEDKDEEEDAFAAVSDNWVFCPREEEDEPDGFAVVPVLSGQSQKG